MSEPIPSFEMFLGRFCGIGKRDDNINIQSEEGYNAEKRNRVHRGGGLVPSDHCGVTAKWGYITVTAKPFAGGEIQAGAGNSAAGEFIVVGELRTHERGRGLTQTHTHT